MYRLEQSEFDSVAFERPSYVMRLGGEPLDHVAEEIRRRVAEGAFVVAKVDADDVTATRSLLSIGMRKVCVQIELRKTLEARAASEPTSPSVQDDLGRAAVDVDAHAGNFRFDRLSLDPFVRPEHRIAFYGAWIRNSLDGRMGVIAMESGFLSYRIQSDSARIDLLSVIHAGRGTAGRLLAAVESSAFEAGCRSVSVVTECENSRAVAVYRRSGFDPVAYFSVFHAG